MRRIHRQSWDEQKFHWIYPALEITPIAFVRSIHSFGVNVKEAAFFFPAVPCNQLHRRQNYVLSSTDLRMPEYFRFLSRRILTVCWSNLGKGIITFILLLTLRCRPFLMCNMLQQDHFPLQFAAWSYPVLHRGCYLPPPSVPAYYRSQLNPSGRASFSLPHALPLKAIETDIWEIGNRNYIWSMGGEP